MKEESDRLIDAWLDGTLDSQEAGELNAWVKESPGHAAQFADRTHLHSSLLEWGAAERLRSRAQALWFARNPRPVILVSGGRAGR